MLCAKRILSSKIAQRKILRSGVCEGSKNANTRNYGQIVPDHLLVEERDVEKYSVDPRVRELSDKIVYSQYLESRSLCFDRKKNARVLSHLARKKKAINYEEMIATPAQSIALKYLNPALGKSEEASAEEPEEDATDWEEAPEPEEKNAPYMPYAVTDSFERLSTPQSEEPEEPAKISELNEDYIALYEKYLLTKDQRLKAQLSKFDKTGAAERANEPPDWMTQYEQYNPPQEEENSTPVTFYGTPDPAVPVSEITCGGCGAPLQCQDPAIPGYLPSELFVGQPAAILRSSPCQRCHFMRNYRTALEVTVRPEEYPQLLSHIRKTKAAVILMVDLTDFPCSIWSGILDVIGKSTQVFVVGNKIDLLPKDCPRFLENVEKSLRKTITAMGIAHANIKSVNLISAKTKYGVEELINRLHKFWGYKGDLYVIGCTNVGKSLLFNTLLQSDYCKIQAADLVQRATVSPWPGTTLNLLKFPILNPVRFRLWQRTERLIAEREDVQEADQYRTEKLKETGKLTYASLRGGVGKTFTQNLLREGPGYIGTIANHAINYSGRLGLNENHKIYKNSRWCYDTPGAILPDQILHLLTTKELLLTLPRSIISPRTFVLFRDQTLFLAGLGRLDFLEGCRSIWCTVFASHVLPVTICETADADELYGKLLTTEAFSVPEPDPERLKLFPALGSREFKVTGVSKRISCADIVLSSAGWIALTAQTDAKIALRAWTPEARGIRLREPALLSNSINLKGYRIPESQAYTRGKRVYAK